MLGFGGYNLVKSFCLSGCYIPNLPGSATGEARQLKEMLCRVLAVTSVDMPFPRLRMQLRANPINPSQ